MLKESTKEIKLHLSKKNQKQSRGDRVLVNKGERARMRESRGRPGLGGQGKKRRCHLNRSREQVQSKWGRICEIINRALARLGLRSL